MAIGIQPTITNQIAYGQVSSHSINKEIEYKEEGEISTSSSESKSKSKIKNPDIFTNNINKYTEQNIITLIEPDEQQATGTASSNINSNANGQTDEMIIVPENQSTVESSSTVSTSSQVSAQSSNEVYGDFNGDGRDDLAIAVADEDLDSATTGEILSNAGAVHVIYGSPSGLSATTPIKNQIWTQNSPSVADSSEEGDQFGSSLAAGDFNGDGHDDLAIGVLFEDVGSPSILNAGAVSVIYGSPSGLSATTVPDQIWSQDTSNVADSSESDDNFGGSLVAGDFNADSRDDLAIGVFAEDVGSPSILAAGAVSVIYGSSSGLSATTVPDQIWSQDTSNVADSSESGDHFGGSLAAGDFNADGNEDLAIGVNSEDVVSAGDNAGAVNVIYGSSSGLSATTVPDQFWTQNSANVEDSSESGDSFGGSLAAGDFNTDGNEDLAIGVPLEDVDVGGPIIDSAGAVNVLYGSLNGLSATSPIPDQFWTLGFDSNPMDLFGFSLAGGDFNADGNEDLVIGIPNRGIPSPGNAAGAALVIYGSSDGLSFTAQLPFKFLTQNYPNVEDSSEGGDGFGSSLAAGDFNADGNEDLAIGVSAEDVVSIPDNAGAVNVIYGSSVGLSPTQAPVFDQFFSQTSPDIGLAPDPGDQFGRSLG